jgi:hypothetical protein
MLETPNLIGLQPDVGQAPQPGGDAIDRLAGLDLASDDRARGFHPFTGLRRQLHRLAASDRDDVLQRQLAPNGYRHGTRRLARREDERQPARTGMPRRTERQTTPGDDHVSGGR